MKIKFAHLLDSSPAASAEKIIVRGIHLDISPALHAAVLAKGARLLRHGMRLVRIRIDLEYDHTRGKGAQFVAKGRVEISGPDLNASVASEDAHKSFDLLIDKLDRMLRERTRTRTDRRNNRPAGTEFCDQIAQADGTAARELVAADDGAEQPGPSRRLPARIPSTMPKRNPQPGRNSSRWPSVQADSQA